MRTSISALALCLLAACSTGHAVEPTAEQKAMRAAQDAAQELQRNWTAHLAQSMNFAGPASGVAYAEDVNQITAELSTERQVTMGRSSLRLRNPDNKGPRWVQDWLKDTGERRFEGLEPVEDVVDTRQGKVARYLLPLEVRSPCMSCHGPKENLAPEVKAELKERYPRDKATGYLVGDLRGVIWVEVPID